MPLQRPTRSPGEPLPLHAADVPQPAVHDHEVLIRVHVCGVCRTDLDVAEGRVAAAHYPIIPGHQVVGDVVEAGPGVDAPRVGDRVGVAWINWACGVCRWCRGGQENLCPRFRSTGGDADGGYAELMVAPAAFTHAIPDALDDVHAAPLLCAGAVGWRALKLADVREGDPLGFTGFGASAHLVLPLARHRHPTSPIYVFARSAEERAFARELGAEWAGASDEAPPRALGAIIDTTPAWKPVVDALPNLMPGGRLVINAIRKIAADREELLRIDYARDLWMERQIMSVANVTRRDVREVLDVAAKIGLTPTVETMPLGDAGAALTRLRAGSAVRGATVLTLER